MAGTTGSAPQADMELGHGEPESSATPRTSSPSPVSVAKPQLAASEPPDGGLKAWLTVVGGWLCQFCSFGFINALGTFQYVYEKEILPHESASDISWILTMQLFLMFFLSQPVGLGVDMFGARPILIPAFLFSVGGLIALSFATRYWQIFLAQSLCFGLGAAGAFIPGLVASGQFFKKKRALALGIVTTGSSCGGVIFPIMLARLFDQIGFRATMRYTALMVGIMLALATVLVSTHNPPKGLAARRSLLSLATFKNPVYVLFVSGSFLFFWGLFGPFDYLPLFSTMSPATSSIGLYTVSIINAASIPGRVLPNMYANRFGSLRTISVCSLLAALSILVIWLPINYHRSLGGLIVFTLVFGFTSGAFVSLMTPALIDVAGGHTSDLGVMVGTFFAIVALASLTGLPIQGAIASDGGSGGKQQPQLMGLIVFCGVIMLAGTGLLACAYWLTEKRKRRDSQAAEK
ncbi:hypothetical protein VTK73DRAFT_4139 [Phialemonium thermophilum]|uniref:Major facilitator superfamily (MFS) profile domain-containing protein n=1 Tax=Phialemonium thermophilum TaxID=223376 RepID=A0ABR3WVR8_9PEZI